MAMCVHHESLGLPLELIRRERCWDDDFGDSPRDGLFARLDGRDSTPSPREGAARHPAPRPRGRRGNRRGRRQDAAPTTGIENKLPCTSLDDEDASTDTPSMDDVDDVKSGSADSPASDAGSDGRSATTSAEQVQQSWPDSATTVMLRNIPNRYTAEELLAEMLAQGFEGGFDFFYLPIDFKTKRNRGYGFVNFHNANLAKQFVMAFHHRKLTRYSTQKILEISPALTQGFEANVAQFVRKDPQRIQNPWFRPMIFQEDGDRSLTAPPAVH